MTAQMTKTLKAERVSTPPNPRVRSSAMKIGDIAFVVDSYINGYLLRTYDRYVSLSDPNKVWSVSNTEPNFEVEILPPGSVLQLTVKE